MTIFPVLLPAFSIVLTFIAVFTFPEHLILIARRHSPTWISPLVAPALTCVLIFTVVFPFLEKLTLPRFSARHYLGANADIAFGAGLDVRLDFHTCVFLS